MGYYNKPSVLNGVKTEKDKNKKGQNVSYASVGAYSASPGTPAPNGSMGAGALKAKPNDYKVDTTPFSASGNTALYGTGVATPNKDTGAGTTYASHMQGEVTGASPSVVQGIGNGTATPIEEKNQLPRKQILKLFK